jgi:hypothetical protein
MKTKTAGDLMVPLREYPVIDISGTILDAVVRLRKSRRNMEPGRQPFQAVLVADENGNIIGKLGQLALLKTLEPGLQVFGDRHTLEKAGVSDLILKAAVDNVRGLQPEFSEMCRRAGGQPIAKAMHPFKEHIDIGASMNEVIHFMVEWRTLSILVTDKDRPVGLIRLSDLCDEVIEEMHRTANADDSGDSAD